MKYATLKNILNQMTCPVYYRNVPNGEELPFAVWYQQLTENMAADNTVWKKRPIIYIDLYTAHKDFVLEQELEHILNKAELYWESTETTSQDEATTIVSYTIEPFIEE